MIGLQSGEEKIGEVVGWSREKVNRYETSRSQIVPKILLFAKTFQKGRGTQNVPNGTKNERGVTSRSQIGTQILIFAKSFQSGRVPEFGTNVPKNERSVTSRSKIGAEILVLAKTFQAGRAPSNGANAPKNERSVTSRSQIGAEILVFAKTFQRDLAPKNGANAPKNEREVNTFEFIFLRVENPFRVENTVNQKTNAHRGVYAAVGRVIYSCVMVYRNGWKVLQKSPPALFFARFSSIMLDREIFTKIRHLSFFCKIFYRRWKVLEKSDNFPFLLKNYTVGRNHVINPSKAGRV